MSTISCQQRIYSQASMSFSTSSSKNTRTTTKFFGSWSPYFIDEIQTSKCQGKGIFIFNKINDIARWKSASRDTPVEQYVCQRYLLNPLLFGGRKFDMRIYALCTSYNPLTIYLYRAGFARFAHDRYDNTDT